ncbi:putative mitochondrial protein (mitochondrion) [Arabidopsis thaliana]
MEFFQLSRKIGCNITQSPIYLFLARKTNRCLCPAHTDFILAVVG